MCMFITCVALSLSGLYLVVDEKGTFREDNFQKALAVLGQTGLEAPGGEGESSMWHGDVHTRHHTIAHDTC